MKRLTSIKKIAFYVSVNIVSIFFAFYLLNISPFNLNKPWVTSGDHIWVYTVVENIKNSGSITNFSHFGWPFFGDFTSWSGFSPFEYFYFYFTSLFLNSYTIVNFYVIIGFILVSTFTFLMFQKLKFSLTSSFIFTLILTLLPWHFQRALWHVSYANYFIIPLFVILLHELIYKIYSKKYIIKITLILLLISTSLPYYWAFVEIILFFIIIFQYIDQKINLKKISWDIYLLSIIPIVQFFQVLILKGNQIYPVLDSPIIRFFGYVEKYSGSFIALILPSPISLITYFGKFRSGFDKVSNLGLGESGPWNSLIGVAAIIFALLLFIILATSNFKPRFFNLNKDKEKETKFFNYLLVSFIISLFFYWTTGFGAIFSFFITDWIRSWGRFYIFIVYFAFVLTSLVIRTSSFWKNLSINNRKLIFVIFSLIALIDQGLKPVSNGFEAAQTLNTEIKEFSNQLNKKLGKDCPVLQLPIMRFPESGNIGDVTDYDHFWLYLSNPERKYSYGAVKGSQQANWQNQIETKTVKKIAAQAAAVGYCAVVVDLRAYKNAVETGNSWIKATGQPLAVSSKTRLAAFKINPSLSTKQAQESLITLTWKGKSDTGIVQGTKQIDFNENKIYLYALNPNKNNVRGQISFGVRGGDCNPSQNVTIENLQNNQIITKFDVSKNIKTIIFNIDLKSLEQKIFDFKISSQKCNVEWYSNAKISIRNEKFKLL